MRTILVAAGVAVVLGLLGTPLAMRLFNRRGYGQLIREEGPAAQATKRGTPAMGGTVIVIATVAGYFAAHATTGQGIVGVLFDRVAGPGRGTGRRGRVH